MRKIEQYREAARTALIAASQSESMTARNEWIEIAASWNHLADERLALLKARLIPKEK